MCPCQTSFLHMELSSLSSVMCLGGADVPSTVNQYVSRLIGTSYAFVEYACICPKTRPDNEFPANVGPSVSFFSWDGGAYHRLYLTEDVTTEITRRHNLVLRLTSANVRSISRQNLFTH